MLTRWLARRGVYVDLTLGDDRTFHSLLPAPPPPVAELMARLGMTSFDAFDASQLGVFGRLREHKVAVGGGYPVADALAAATSVAAEACALAGETGRLAEGYAAGVLVVDGDLARDVSLLSASRAVLVRGAAVDVT